MAADPEPHHRVAIASSKRAVTEAYASREERTSRVHLLEVQARVVGISLELPICTAGLPLYVRRQARECLPEPLGGDGSHASRVRRSERVRIERLGLAGAVLGDRFVGEIRQ
jgi:hypothetical protein